MQNKQFKLISFGMFISLSTLFSCVDNDYDLNKNIDLTITVGGSEFAIPGGNTSKWTLEEILDIDPEGIIQTNKDGDYILSKGEDPVTTDVVIDQGNPIHPNIDDKNTELYFVGNGNHFQADIPNGEKVAFNIHKTGMPEEIIDLTDVKVNMPTNIHFSLEQHIAINDIYFTALEFTFPTYLKLSFNGATPANWEITANNHLRFKGNKIKVDGTEISIIIENIYFDPQKSNPSFNKETHTVDIVDEITMTGTLSVESNAITKPTKLNMNTSITMQDSYIQSVTGNINPKIDIEDQIITLDDLPDFLKDDAVVLDLYNPKVNLSLTNEARAPIRINALLKSMKASTSHSVPVTLDLKEGNGLHNEVTTNICLAQNAAEAEVAEGVVVIQTDINSLIRKIPDEIILQIEKTEIIDYATQVYTFELNNAPETIYKITTDYKLDAPLAFGKDLEIVYKDSVDGWHEDIKDYEISQVILEGIAYNGIPLDIDLIGIARDKDRNSLADKIEVVVNNNKIIPAAKVANKIDQFGKDRKVVEQPTEISIVVTIKEKVPGAIKELDGLLFTANAQSNQIVEGVTLNEEQFFQLQKLKLKIPGGAKIDLN